MNSGNSLSTGSFVVTLTLCLVFFALSWLRPQRIVTLPANGRRSRLLVRVGIAGSLGILVVAAAATVHRITQLKSLEPSSGYEGWLLRPAALLAAGIVVAIAALAMHAEPLPPVGERAISPRRSWWAFTPRGIIWATAAAAALVLATAGWLTLIGVPMPAEWAGTGTNELPVYVPTSAGVVWAPGAGWPNHLATLLLVIAAVLTLVVTLGRDANRPLSIHAPGATAAQTRRATARVLSITLIGGVLLTLGAVWTHTGAIGDSLITLSYVIPGEAPTEPISIGSGYQDFVWLFRSGGSVFQALGAAILLRLGVDSWRALRFARSVRRPDGADHGAVFVGAGARR